jgi:2-phospho-L-lactate transferase/gluconeogenesis factor (CofD/UPF0052 family)
MRNCTRDEGGPFGVGNQVLISSHRKLLRSKAVVVNVAENVTSDKIVLRFFRWNAHRDPLEAIDSLEPFRTTELRRPG